jgi:hypothetical protein
MKPACTSSSGSLPDGFRIRYQRGTIRRTASSPRKFKVAHYPVIGHRAVVASYRPPVRRSHLSDTPTTVSKCYKFEVARTVPMTHLHHFA